jgi:hypothetical protein
VSENKNIKVPKIEFILKKWNLIDGNKNKPRITDTHYQVNCPLCGDTRQRLGIRIEEVNKSHSWHCFNCSSGS